MYFFDCNKVYEMQLILLIIASAIIAGLAFWVQAYIYEKWYEREDKDEEH